MIRFRNADRSDRLIALFPQLLGVGGVQEAGRLTASALSDICRRRSWLLDALSLNDSPGAQVAKTGEQDVCFQGFGRAKLQFALSAMRRVRPSASTRTLLVLAAHPNLAPLGAWLRRICPGSKTIVIAHGIEAWSTLSPLRRRALLRATAILAPSRYTARMLAEVQGVAPEKIHVLPWPLNPDFLRMAAEPAALPLPAQFPDGQIILTVGRWAKSERYKGADELIRAVAELRTKHPDLQLVAGGGGDDLARLAQLARSLNVADRVHFFDSLSREQIGACYSRADIFALPSTGEGFGLVFLEAMAFAKPVVAAAFGGPTDVVEHDVNGLLIAPHDVHQLVAALDKLLRDASRRVQMGRAGADIARKKYCSAAFESGLRSILAECGFPETHDNSLLALE